MISSSSDMETFSTSSSDSDDGKALGVTNKQDTNTSTLSVESTNETKAFLCFQIKHDGAIIPATTMLENSHKFLYHWLSNTFPVIHVKQILPEMVQKGFDEAISVLNAKAIKYCLKKYSDFLNEAKDETEHMVAVSVSDITDNQFAMGTYLRNDYSYKSSSDYLENNPPLPKDSACNTLLNQYKLQDKLTKEQAKTNLACVLSITEKEFEDLVASMESEPQFFTMLSWLPPLFLKHSCEGQMDLAALSTGNFKGKCPDILIKAPKIIGFEIKVDNCLNDKDVNTSYGVVLDLLKDGEMGYIVLLDCEKVLVCALQKNDTLPATIFLVDDFDFNQQGICKLHQLLDDLLTKDLN